MKKLLSFLFILYLSFPVFYLNAKTLHWNQGRGYIPFKYASKEGVWIDNNTDTLQYDYFKLENSSKDFTLSFRARNINGHPTKKYGYRNRAGKSLHISNPHWGCFIVSEKEVFALKVNCGEKMSANEPVPSLEVALFKLANHDEKIKSVSLTEGVNPYDGDNIWRISVEKGKLNIYSGDKVLNNILSTYCNSQIKGFGFYAGWGDELLITDISADYTSLRTEPEYFSFESLREYLNQSNDEMEGYWTIFDRELDESLLKLGGFYNLACVKDNDGYKFIYIDGATVNSKGWKPGDLKAVLTPSYFPGIYDVEWIDSMKETMSHDIKAQTAEGNTLNFQFPYQSSKLRLRKILQ